MLSAAGSAV